MISLLAKLFIKNRGNVNEPRVRGAYGRLCSVTGIALNICLFITKYIAGSLSGSVAITADAFNNLSDAGSSVITLFGFRLAEKKPDARHPFGHGRFEYVSGFVVSVLIIVMGFELGRSSLSKILHPTTVSFEPMVFVILIISVAVKLYMFAYNRRWGKKLDAPAMRATAMDSFSDCVATAVVLISTLLARFANINIDGWCGVAVALFILYTGVSTAKGTLSPLLGGPPSRELVSEIESIVLSHKCIIGMHDLIIHDYGPGRRMISLHGEVSADGNLLTMHDDIDHIEKELEARLGCSAVIHMDPVVSNDETVDALRARMEKEIREIDPNITIHDFRVVRGPTHSNLIFDAVVPMNCKLPDSEIIERVKSRVATEWDSCYAVIRIDKPYV